MLAKAREAAGQVIADPNRADQRVADLRDGLNLLQAAQRNRPDVLHTPRHVSASLLQTHIAENAVRQNKLEQFFLRAKQFVQEGFRVKFSAADWFGYMLSFFTWSEGIVKANLPPGPAVPEEIGDNYSVAVVGDWGTGLYGAPFSAKSIEQQGDYDLLLHLGDVYYSGTREEIQERFDALWPNLPNAASRSLNGNHEMYTGGHAYFEDLLPRLNQSSSYFALQNQFWTLVALDSAYDQKIGGQAGDLKQPQLDWLRGLVAQSGGRRLVLFSHHQPYTLLDQNKDDTLLNAVLSCLGDKRIFAWYWGHEHRCLLYDPHSSGIRGRCVGHGGFPEFKADLGNAPVASDVSDVWRRLPANNGVPGGLVLAMNNLYIPGFETDFEPHGYMRLDFRGEELHESVLAPEGAIIYDRQLV
jgi:hypothetical protein